jgi:uncharacterized protein with gpF-like domain
MPAQLKLLRRTIPNAGTEAWYYSQILALIQEMSASIQFWIEAEYKKAPPRVAELAEDATPSDKIKVAMNKLSRRWLKRFDESGPKIAEAYVRRLATGSSKSMQRALKDAGWTVKFKVTPTIRDAMDASISENVSLIRSIPQQYLQSVEGVIYRAYAAGQDLQKMTEGILKVYGVTQRRAAYISQDQTRKLNANTTRARELELGLTDGIWHHSGGGAHPRPDHVKAGKDKRKFKIAEGCLISGEYIQPGELPGCKCFKRVVLPY